MIQMQDTAMTLNMVWKNSWVGFLLFTMLWLGGCAGTSHVPQEGPLSPPEQATPLATQLILEGNQRFAEHRLTAAIGKYEEAIHVAVESGVNLHGIGCFDEEFFRAGGVAVFLTGAEEKQRAVALLKADCQVGSFENRQIYRGVGVRF